MVVACSDLGWALSCTATVEMFNCKKRCDLEAVDMKFSEAEQLAFRVCGDNVKRLNERMLSYVAFLAGVPAHLRTEEQSDIVGCFA